MNLSMFFHEFLAILVVCTLGGWAPLFERSWVRSRSCAPPFYAYEFLDLKNLEMTIIFIKMCF